MDAEWTTFAKCDPATGARTGQLPCWFTATCHVKSDRIRVGSVRLRDIGAQARAGVLKLRVSGAKNPVLKASKSGSGKGGKTVKAVGGFYAVEPSAPKGARHPAYSTRFRLRAPYASSSAITPRRWRQGLRRDRGR